MTVSTPRVEGARPFLYPSARSGFAGRLVCLWFGALGFGLLFAAFASGEGGGRSLGRMHFDIPAQSLVTGLQAYSAASGVQVLYESDVAAGLRSREIKGEFTPERALRAMLEGSDLVVQYSRADAITLTLPRAEIPELPLAGYGREADIVLDPLHVTGEEGASPAEVSTYISAIQQDVQAALRNAPRTRAGNYRAGIELWVESSRRVGRAQVVRSSGDEQRDRAIADVLAGLVLRRDAPANIEQPVRLVINVRSASR